MSVLFRVSSYIAVAALAAAVSVLSTAGATRSIPPSAALPQAPIESFHLDSHDVGVHFSISGKKGPVAGDHGVFTGLIYWHKAHAGTDLGTCDFVSSARLQCEIQLNLTHRGRINITGTIGSCQECGKKGGVPNLFAIVGGTGEFSAAQGWVVDRPYDKGTRDHLVVNIQ